MGFLWSDTVVECSATDLVGEYVGQTGPKVTHKFDEALGQVLFVDEAYRLGEGPFAKEAVDEIVDCLTKERYKSRMIVILAGYEDEINGLLRVNPGLSSRFPEEIMFNNMDVSMCLQLLKQKLKSKISVSNLQIELDESEEGMTQAVTILQQLTNLPGWGNGRDVDTLAARVASTAIRDYKSALGSLRTTWMDVNTQLRRLYTERQARHDTSSRPLSTSKFAELPVDQQTPSSHSQPHTKTQTSATAVPEVQTGLVENADTVAQTDCERDPGVSEAVWQQLQSDKAIQAKLEAEQAQDITTSETEMLRSTYLASEASARANELEHNLKANEDDEARRLLEEQRIKAVKARRDAAAHAARLKALQEERKREAVVQQKLRQIGVCVMGFRWIKQAGGYRCAGGSHFVTDAQLGL